MTNMMKQAFTNETWSKMADNYERTTESFVAHWADDALEFAHQRILDAMQQRVLSSEAAGKLTSQSQAPMFVDVGCGTGALCLTFAEKYISSAPTATGVTTDAAAAVQDVRIIATDLADGMLARVDEKLDARPRYQRFRSRVSTVQMDGQLLDKLADASVDVIGSNFGLSIFPDRVQAWCSAARVLRDGGMLFATVWDAQSPNLRWADAFAAMNHEIELARVTAASTTNVDTNGATSDDGSGAAAASQSAPILFVPSLRAGHGGIEDELRAAGFRNIETRCTQHSIDASSLFVDALLRHPAHIERLGTARHAELLRRISADESARQRTHTVVADRGDSHAELDDQQQSTLPAMIEFVAHTFVATK